IGDVGPKNALFDSALERRFIEALRRRPTDATPRLDVQDEIVRGKAGYVLRAGDRLWMIEPQVQLGPDDGVVARCQPDFVLWPQNAPGCLPIAVFMDGWQYHKDSVGVDISKRMAVARSGKFAVWTLTSDDIAQVLEPGTRRPETLWAGAFAGNAASAEQLYTMLGVDQWRSFHQATAFEQLRSRLSVMTDADLERIAIALSLR
ncbi:MAG: hypothetical protein J0626_05340, partial [Rhodospirillaceae bacterium]|nr:hypothetical protein [Rhodospirillaceae bacterium]